MGLADDWLNVRQVRFLIKSLLIIIIKSLTYLAKYGVSNLIRTGFSFKIFLLQYYYNRSPMDPIFLLNLFICCQLLYLFNAKSGSQFSYF